MSNFYSNSVDYTFAFALPNFCNKLTIIFLSCKGIIRTRSLSLSTKLSQTLLGLNIDYLFPGILISSFILLFNFQNNCSLKNPQNSLKKYLC